MIQYQIIGQKAKSRDVVKLELAPDNMGGVDVVAEGYITITFQADGSVYFPGSVGREVGLKLDDKGRIGTPLTPDRE